MPLNPIYVQATNIQELSDMLEKEYNRGYEAGMKASEKKEWLTPDEAAELLGIKNPHSLSRIVNEDTKNIIKTRPWGNRRKQYNKKSLEEYLNRK